jgi:hypothetical protein
VEIRFGKFNLEIKLSITRNHYYLLYSPLIKKVIGTTVNPGPGEIESRLWLIEVSKRDWDKERTSD